MDLERQALIVLELLGLQRGASEGADGAAILQPPLNVESFKRLHAARHAQMSKVGSPPLPVHHPCPLHMVAHASGTCHQHCQRSDWQKLGGR